MSYLVLARKYRPQTFGEVVQQSHITQTLARAIVADRVAHALLFTGPRGTGKTTIARILAKALNCEKGPAPEPCNQCPSCVEITNGNAADVFEIDGASNNSVDQVRELRENIPYMPARSRYKIYIIDEVHMLSIAAFNALLKTLEEPPTHILFLFATTEPQKIPVTILSRCQRHDMRRISTLAIADHLRLLCEKEKFELPDEALTMVAREANGSMRDALSLLDQVLVCSDGTLEYEQILNLFGVIDRKAVFDLAAAVIKSDLSSILDIVADRYQRGQDMRRLYAELVEHFRNLIIIKLGHNIENLVDLPAQEIDYIKKHVSNISVAALSQLFEFLFREEQRVRLAAQPKLAIEMVFFRLLQMSPTLPIADLITQLNALKKGLPEKQGDMEGGADKRDISSRGPSIQKEAPATANTNLGPNLKTDPSYQGSSVPKKKVPSSKSRIDPQPTEPSSSTSEPDSGYAPDGKDVNKRSTEGNIPPKNTQLWSRLLDVVLKEKPSLESILSNCRPSQVRNNCLEIEINDNGYAVKVIKKNLPQLEQWCQQLSGDSVALKLVTKSDPADKKKNVKNQAVLLRNEALAHQVVLDAIEVFNGKVAEVKILSGGKDI